MENIAKQFDGQWRTPSGLCAMVPLHVSGTMGEKAEYFWFEFKATPVDNVIRIEWPSELDIAIVPKEVADVMVRNGWAKDLGDKFAEQYNTMVDLHNADHPEADGTPHANVIVKEVEATPLVTNIGENERAVLRSAEEALRKQGESIADLANISGDNESREKPEDSPPKADEAVNESKDAIPLEVAAEPDIVSLGKVKGKR